MGFQKIELLMNIEILSEKDRIILNLLREKETFTLKDFDAATNYLKKYIFENIQVGANGGYIWI
jgi:hypothetical protein